MKAVLTLLLSLGVPKWGIALLLGSLVSWLGPKLIDDIQRDRARRVVKAARMEPEDKRVAADRLALELAGQDTRVLMLIAREALEHSRLDLADTAMQRLRDQGVPERALVQLDDERYGPLPLIPAQVVLRAERLLDRSQSDEASLLVARATRRWPADPELRALRERLHSAPSDPVA